MPPVPKRRRPTANWTCREVLDANVIEPDDIAKCDFCDRRIRWIHVLEHDDWHRSMQAGCCCAMRLCHGYDAEGAERELKNRAGRLMRFVDLRRWRPSRTNPENIVRTVKMPDGRNVKVTVFLKDGRYMVYLGYRKSSDNYCHWGKYASQSEALAVAFQLIEEKKSAE